MTMDENTANVPTLQEKLSKEAFGGSGVKLLNSKNILIADTEGTQGMFTCMLTDGSEWHGTFCISIGYSTRVEAV